MNPSPANCIFESWLNKLTKQVLLSFDFIIQFGKCSVLVFVYRFEVCIQLQTETIGTWFCQYASEGTFVFDKTEITRVYEMKWWCTMKYLCSINELLDFLHMSLSIHCIISSIFLYFCCATGCLFLQIRVPSFNPQQLICQGLKARNLF